MKEFSQKYAIICLLEDVEVGYEYPSSRWPSHITLADTFSIDGSVEDLEDALDILVAECRPVGVRATGIDFFGSAKDVEVIIFERNKEIVELHFRIVETLVRLGVVFNDPQYARDGYRPHSTVQKDSKVRPGDFVDLDNLAIIDMFPNDDPYRRKVIKTSYLE